MDLLQQTKFDLRINHNFLDNLLKEEINSCKADLERVGIEPKEEPMVNSLIRLYTRASHNYQGQGEIYWKRYQEMRNAVSLNVERRKSNG